MAISAEEKYLLNRMNSVASKVQLGTLVQNAESGGLSAGAVTATELATDAVETLKIKDLNVTAGKLAADSVTTAKILNANVTLAKLAAGVAPSHVVKFAGKFTTVGGDANESIAAAGVVAGDIALVSLQTAGAVARTILSAIPATDAINLVFSGDPAADHIVSYMVLRAAS
jgi:hypothetical protein